MSRYMKSACPLCGGDSWGKPGLPCVRCLPDKNRRRPERPSQKRGVCVDCKGKTSAARCWSCHKKRIAKRQAERLSRHPCEDCGRPVYWSSQTCMACWQRRRSRVRRRGHCLTLARGCPVAWGPLDHRHCPHCHRPMWPDAAQCSGCTALELLDRAPRTAVVVDERWSMLHATLEPALDEMDWPDAAAELEEAAREFALAAE